MKPKKLKLFIWTDFEPDYTSGLAFAIAASEGEARRLIIRQNGGREPYCWGMLEVRRLDHRVARMVSGGS